MRQMAVGVGRTVVVVGLLAVGLVAAAPASAASQERVLLQFPELVVDTSCGFEIDITFPVQKQYLTIIADENGEPFRLLITGQLFIRFTNPVTGESVTESISGPEVIDLVRGTDAGTGRWAFPGGVEIFSGRTDFVGGTFVGHVTSFCEALAA